MKNLVDSCLRGVGQVIFLNSTTCGAMILAALCYADLWLGFLAAIGTLSATLSASVCKTDATAIQAGLFGYNGCLVGCAFSVFLELQPWSLNAVLATAAFAAATAPLAAALKPICGAVPQWTLAFNFLTLAVLCVTRPLAGVSAPQVGGKLLSELSMFELGCAPLIGISQIFVVNDAVAGAIILAAIAYYSPKCALLTFNGSLMGMSMGIVHRAPAGDIASGLWGYNPALTSLAVAVFFVPGQPSYTLAIFGAAGSALLFAGLKSVMASALGTPALTLPFCVVASLCMMAPAFVPALKLAENPHSPEMNAPRKA